MTYVEKIEGLVAVGISDHHVVEMIPSSVSASGSPSTSIVTVDNDDLNVLEEIKPLLSQSEKPKINIFNVSYPRIKPRVARSLYWLKFIKLAIPSRFYEFNHPVISNGNLAKALKLLIEHQDQLSKLAEKEISILYQFSMWAWNGSRYSGLVCMTLSSTIYFVMEVLSDIFSGQSIPLFETAFTRSTIILILSYLWLRRTGQPIFGPSDVRSLLFARALMGYFSLFCFIYCFQRLPLSQAILLSFIAPIIASIFARVIFHEKLKIAAIVGLSCSFFGVIFIYQGIESGDAVDRHSTGSHHIYAVLAGSFSSISAGISYCLIRAGAKASDQPVVTVFAFGILATPAAAICTFAFQEFVLPGVYTFILMLVLGVLAFIAEVFLARGLQLEKTSRIINILYIEAFLSQIWGMASSRFVALSFGRLVGCLIIFISVSCTIFIGPDKEIE